jgi:hypothetical protein
VDKTVDKTAEKVKQWYILIYSTVSMVKLVHGQKSSTVEHIANTLVKIALSTNKRAKKSDHVVCV